MWKSNTSKVLRSTRARNLILPQLYHISFEHDTPDIWTPRLPDGTDEGTHVEIPDEDKFPYPEPSVARISVSTSIEGCFIGVYPNVSAFFEEDNIPHMNYFVYCPIFKGNERVVTNETLTKDRVVWDAVVTGEYCILDPVRMQLIGEIEIYNTNKEKTRMIHPFGDVKLPKESVGPERVKFKWIDGPEPLVKDPSHQGNSLSQFR